MGSGQFNIRPESLLAASQRFERSSEELAQVIQTLQSKVLGAGSPWGHDEMGSVFAEAYTECSGVGLQAMQHLAEQLASIAEGLQAMGHNLTSTDQAGQTAFDQTRSGL
jgi:uncharacterized protein YukE